MAHSEVVNDSCAAPTSASNAYASELASREVAHLVEAYDTPWLLPKHKIFISHSGRQKDFAEQLCEDLETHGYYPFFDKRSDSLFKGEKFPPLIFKAARDCLLVIVLISEDFFTRSKWPMLELATFVQAHKTRKDLRILPVLLGLTIEDLRSTAKWSEFWLRWGEQDQRLTHDVIKEWQEAVEALRPFNMILKSSYDGDVKLRKGIVKFIGEMMLPDIQSDILNVQGRERLCKEVLSIFDTIPSTSRICENATVLGVYGIGGAGKSTLCRITTEYVRSEFLGRVCIVELGKEDSTVDLQRRVLRRLFRDDEDFLMKHIHTEKEGLNRLRELMPRERVFFALDNVSDDPASIYTAKSFLGLKFHSNSMVMVTSRSGDVLCGSLGIREGSCMRCPSVTKDEALQILLKEVNFPLERLDTEQTQILHRTVELSFFEAYHPMALQVFAAQLGTDEAKWRKIKLDLQWASDVEHPLFSTIETNYMRLPDQHTKDMFMDIALFAPECLCGVNDIIGWLNDTINLDCHVDDIKQKLKALRVKSLLEIWKMEDETVRIHDLYGMLAERNASVHNVAPRFIYQRGAIVAPQVLLDNDRARIVERAAFVEAKFEMLELEACKKLKVISARRCEKLMALCIQRLGCLVSLELAVCALESLDLSGLSNLRWLHVSSCKDLIRLDASEAERLRHVNVSKCSKLADLDFKNCLLVKSVSFLYNDRLRHVNLGSGRSLECLTLWFCGSLIDVEISGVAYLTILKKRGCPRLLAMKRGDIMCRDLQYMSLESWGRLSPTFVRALEMSASLQVLDIWHSCMSRLPDLRNCLFLQELRLSDVDVLLPSNDEEMIQEYRDLMCISTEDGELPVSLEELRIESCKNVVVKEMFWKVQGLRNLRVLSLQDVRVGWDWELCRSSVYKEWSSLKDEYAKSRAYYESLSGEENEDRIEKCIQNNDEQMSMLKGEINVMHQQLSVCMQHRTNATGYLDKIMCWLQAFLDGKRSATGTLDEIMRWLQVCLDGKTSLCRSEHFIKPELQHWETVAENLQKDLGGMFWSSMSETVEVRGSPYWVIEQIIHKTCHACDSLCERLQEVLSKDWPQGDKIRHLMEFCQKAHVKELCGQLVFLTSKQFTDIVQQHNVLEMWERVIIEEVSARRNTPTCKIENDTLIIPRLETLVKRLETLFVCRGWQAESSVELKGQELMECAWDWLLACRVCLSLEQLKGCLAKQSEARCELKLHLHEMKELLLHFDVMFKMELEKFREDVLTSDRGCSFDRFAGLSRCWKVRQWLQEVELFLSEHLTEEQKPEKNLPVKEVCQSISEIKQLLELQEVEEQKPEKKFSIIPPLRCQRIKALTSEAEWLIVKMSQEWPDTESLFHLQSNVKKRVLINVNVLCKVTEIFFDHILQYFMLYGQWVVSNQREKMWQLMMRLDMQQWQCKSFLADSIEIGGKRRRWEHAEEHVVRKDFWFGNSDSCGRLFGPSTVFILDWAETLTTKLTAEMEFTELVLHPSNMAYEQVENTIESVWERVLRLMTLLRDELHFLLSAKILDINRYLFREELKGLWERAGSILWVRLDTFRALYAHVLEVPLRDSLCELMRNFQIFFKESFPEVNEKTMLIESGKLSALIAGGGNEAKKEKKSRSGGLLYTTDCSLLEQSSRKKPRLMKEMASQTPDIARLELVGIGLGLSPSFVEMWDDVNSRQLVSPPLPRCSALRVRRISNCKLIIPDCKVINS